MTTETTPEKITPTLFERSKESWASDLAVALQVAFRNVRTTEGTGFCFDVHQAKEIIIKSFKWIR